MASRLKESDVSPEWAWLNRRQLVSGLAAAGRGAHVHVAGGAAGLAGQDRGQGGQGPDAFDHLVRCTALVHDQFAQLIERLPTDLSIGCRGVCGKWAGGIAIEDNDSGHRDSLFGFAAS